MSKPRDALTTDDAPPTVAVSPFAPGSMIAGRYRIESRLGAGGGGTVWRCTDQKLDAVVALKVVGSEGDLERWRREVAMARRIADRNVCRVHDLGETAELRFVTMELVEGASLRSSIRPDLPAEVTRSLITQVVSGVAAIHAAGVVHRDLKPENVVVANDGRAVIVDFGLAREPAKPQPLVVRVGDARVPSDAVTKQTEHATPFAPTSKPGVTVTNAGVVVGTPRYMSPEQAAGDTVDTRTDVWALGLIAHELLAGAMPGLELEQEGSGRQIADTVDNKWPGVKQILRRCLAMQPDDRYPDARALLAALAPRKRRWPWAVALAGIAATAVVATIVTIAILGDGSTIATPSTRSQAGYRMLQLTTTNPKQWPAETPTSVAISPDGKRFAYTTGGGGLHTRDISGGARVTWKTPTFVAPTDRLDRPPTQGELVSITAIGWFADGSLGLLGTTPDEHHIYRVRENGSFELVYSNKLRFRAALTAAGDRIAIAISGEGLYVLAPGQRDPTQIAAVERGEQLLAVAWSPDGAKLALVRLPVKAGEEAVIQTMQAAGTQPVELWRGHTTAVDPLLAWVTADRLAFTYQDPETGATSLLGIDATTKELDQREELPDGYLGVGSAANGTVLLLRGTARQGVQIINKFGRTLHVLANAESVEHSQVAGWTSDGSVVFLEGPRKSARIASAAQDETKVWLATAWPGTKPGLDVPDTVVDTSVITHRVDPADARFVLIEQISSDGTRRQITRIENDGVARPVRCAGDRATPCVLEQIEDTHVTWKNFALESGAIGSLVHRRELHERTLRDIALSHDGARLAIVDGGNTVTLVDRETGRVLPDPPPAPAGTILQSVGFDVDNELWITGTGLRGHRFGLGATRKTMLYSRANKEHALRSFSRPTAVGIDAENPKLAVVIRDFQLEIWRADGI